MIGKKRIRVLVVDDAVVVRRLLTTILESDPAIEVVGTAANGKIALSKLGQLRPDAVVLDVEMPVMDGLETLREIRKRNATVPVIMFSTLTERGAATTLDALALGASDYVTKPANVGSVREAQERIRRELIPKLKGLCGWESPVSRPPTRQRPAVGRRRERIEVVVIGVSTGGPNALAQVIPALPGDFPVPVLIVQHMPPVFTRLLAERLDARGSLRVREGEDGTPLKPRSVWIAPGDYHMAVVRKANGYELRLNQEPPVNFCRPAVDVLFESAAQSFGPGVLAVVLTGMGHDGTRGCEEIKLRGGQVIAQDEASSVVWGMPGSVVRSGLADRVLPLAQIPEEIVRRVAQSRQSLAVR